MEETLVMPSELTLLLEKRKQRNFYAVLRDRLGESVGAPIRTTTTALPPPPPIWKDTSIDRKAGTPPRKDARTRRISRRIIVHAEENTKLGYPITRATISTNQRGADSSMEEIEFGGQPPKARMQAFFDFMIERERIRVAKEANRPFPWTDNEVLREHKFTNVKREDDRTTRWMRKNWTSPHAADSDIGELLFNCALFRYFGKDGGLGERLTWVRSHWRPEEVVRAALDVRATGGCSYQ